MLKNYNNYSSDEIKSTILSAFLRIKFHPLLFITVFLTLILSVTGCKRENNLVGGENLSASEPKYRFEEMRVYDKQGMWVLPQGLWFSSQTNGYYVGFNDYWQGAILHYKGGLWWDEAQQYGIVTEYNDVIGFSENEVYVCGDAYSYSPVYKKNVMRGIVLKYNGTTWEKILDTVDSLGNSGLVKIHGTSGKDLWTCGFSGGIYHYDGRVWKKYAHPDSLENTAIYTFPNGQTYLLSKYNYAKYDLYTILNYIFRFNGTEFEEYERDTVKIVDGYEANGKFGSKYLWGTTGDKMFTGNKVVFYGNKNNWTYVDWISHTERFVNAVHGRSDTYRYSVGDHGYIRWFNGGKSYQVLNYSEYLVDFKTLYTFGDTLFIGAWDGRSSFVLKGIRTN